MASVGELFISLGIKADEASLKRVDNGIKSIRNGTIALGAAFAGAVVGLDRFVDGSLRGVVALQNLSNQTGLAIEELQKWQQAGQLSNLAISADQIAQSIGNVQQNLSQIRLGQGDITPFQLLGVNVGQDAFGVLDELRGSIKGLDNATATNLLTQIGLTPDFINILKLSRQEFEELSENTFLNPKQRENIDRVGTSIKALKLRFIALKDQAVAKIAPQLNELVQQFFSWLKDNGDKVINIITGFAKGFTLFAQAIGNAFNVLANFISNITGIESGVKALALAFGAITLAMRPMLLGFTALLIILDDIAVYQKGGESLIGNFMDMFSGGDKVVGLKAFAVGVGLLALSFGRLGNSLKLFKGANLLMLGKLLGIGGLVFGAGFTGAKLGKMGAGALNENEGFTNFIDKILGNNQNSINQRIGLNPALSSATGVTTINNNVSINGIQDPIAVRNELTRGLDNITSDTLKRVQSSQGNNL